MTNKELYELAKGIREEMGLQDGPMRLLGLAQWAKAAEEEGLARDEAIVEIEKVAQEEMAAATALNNAVLDEQIGEVEEKPQEKGAKNPKKERQEKQHGRSR